MINKRYIEGRDAAMQHFKLATAPGVPGYNPTLAGQATTGTAPGAGPQAPKSAAPPLAAGAVKAKVLG